MGWLTFPPVGLIVVFLIVCMILFLSLAVNVSGYVLVEDFSTWEYLHDYYPVSGTPETTKGFTVFPSNMIFLWEIESLPHERKHVACNKESKNLIERNTCNQKIETQDIISQSSHEFYQSPEPPQMTGKMIDSIHGKAI